MYTIVMISRSAKPIFSFKALYFLNTFYLRAGLVSEGLFCGEKGTDGSELAAGVVGGGGQPGSASWARRSVTVDQPCGTRVSLGSETRGYLGRWRVAAGGATRYGDTVSAARRNRYGGVLNKYSRTHHLLRSGDSIHVFDQSLS
jgi:hypothetical protein